MTDPVELRRQTRQLLNDEMRDRLGVQRSAAERVETKATVVLGFAATAMGLALDSDLTSAFIGWAVAFYLLSIAFALFVVAIRRTAELDLDPLVSSLWNVTPQYAASVIASARGEAFRRNRGRMVWRVRGWWGSIGALVVATIFTLLHIRYGVELDSKAVQP